MNRLIIEQGYLDEVLNVFAFAQERSFTQISTVEKVNDAYLPKSRTVLLFHLPDHSAFYFTCSQSTGKWSQLQTISRVTGLYFDRPNSKQYRFEAGVKLLTKVNKDTQDFYHAAWMNTRPDLRHVLWQEYLNNEADKYDIEMVCPDFGIVLLFPDYWDIFKLDSNNFANSEREQLIFKDGQWQIFTKAPLIHPLALREMV